MAAKFRNIGEVISTFTLVISFTLAEHIGPT